MRPPRCDTLRASGPSAHQRDIELEDERQGNRLGLEGVRQQGRSSLEEQRQGNRVELEGTRQGNRVQLEGARERNRRSRPASTLIERLREKVAAGQQLTPGEQRVWDSYQRSGRQRGRAGRAGNAATIVNPTTGQRMVLQGGRWVPVQ